MSSPWQSEGAPFSFERATRLRRELSEFVKDGALKDEFKQHQKLFFELCDTPDERDEESMLDWFLFDWFDEKGEGVIDHFLESCTDLTGTDQQVLLDWEDSIHSVFEISSLGRNSVRLREMESGDSFAVTTNKSVDGHPLRRAQFIAARLLPLGDRFIFSGPRYVMPDRESAFEALKISQSLEQLNSPESLEQAQREQCTAFNEFFGCSEISMPPGELHSSLERFQRFMLFERRDPQDNSTMAEKFHSAFGRALKMPDLPSPPEHISDIGEVTILCDEFDGIVLLPDYNTFKRVFQTKSPDAGVPGWRDLVWSYIQDPDIPMVAFERVAEQYHEQVEKVLRILLDDAGFSIEHLYAMLLHYKEPVEGFEDLEDEELLWDLLNGNAKGDRVAKRGSAIQSPAIKGRTQSKKRLGSTKNLSSSAKRPSPKRSNSSAKRNPAGTKGRTRSAKKR